MGNKIRQKPYSVTADCAFRQVIKGCATKRSINRAETWITSEMMTAYCRLHELGYAHSIECWHNGILVGGMYGVSLGRVFFGESMFSDMSNASKIALHTLVRHGLQTGIELIDCQMRTDHLVSLGAREISRTCFQNHLHAKITHMGPQKKWRLHLADKEGIGYADACQDGGNEPNC